MAKIGGILRNKQPYDRLNAKKRKKRRKPKKQEYLSFNDINRTMRNNRGVDERK